MPNNNYLFYWRLNINGRVTQVHVPYISSCVSNFETLYPINFEAILLRYSCGGRKSTAFMSYYAKIHRKYCYNSGCNSVINLPMP